MKEVKNQGLESVNANVGIYSILATAMFTVFNDFGVGVDASEGLVNELAKWVSEGQYGIALAVLIPNLTTPITKIFNKAKVGMDFVNSWNFWTQALTVILVGSELWAAFSPDSFANKILGLVGGQGMGLLWTGVIHLINTGGRFLKSAIGAKV